MTATCFYIIFSLIFFLWSFFSFVGYRREKTGVVPIWGTEVELIALPAYSNMGQEITLKVLAKQPSKNVSQQTNVQY